MVLTPSTMLPLGTPLPAFSLPQVAGDPRTAEDATSPWTWSTANLGPEPVLVLFLCAHCPFVKHIEPELSRLARDYADRIQIVAISSNSILTHPQDGPEGLRAQAERCHWRFPYLFDAEQSVARQFRAACTPDLFLFADTGNNSSAGAASTADRPLVYRGQLDASRPGQADPNQPPLDGRDLRASLEALLTGQPINPEQTPSIGCNIKWHPER